MARNQVSHAHWPSPWFSVGWQSAGRISISAIIQQSLHLSRVRGPRWTTYFSLCSVLAEVARALGDYPRRVASPGGPVARGRLKVNGTGAFSSEQPARARLHSPDAGSVRSQALSAAVEGHSRRTS